jgi:hypothetical protein
MFYAETFYRSFCDLRIFFASRPLVSNRSACAADWSIYNRPGSPSRASSQRLVKGDWLIIMTDPAPLSGISPARLASWIGPSTTNLARQWGEPLFKTFTCISLTCDIQWIARFLQCTAVHNNDHQCAVTPAESYQAVSLLREWRSNVHILCMYVCI